MSTSAVATLPPLAQHLRAWRDRLTPDEAGLPSPALTASGRRRAPGLRREELAQLAGVSADYLVRLEQGRAQHPSPQVVDALARSLRLDAEETDRFYRMAGQLPPSPERMDRQVSASLRRIVARLGESPVSVVDAAWNTVLQNRAADALFGDLSDADDHPGGRGRNRAWRTFAGTGDAGRLDEATRVVVETDIVADLKAACLRLPDDPDLQALVGDLRAVSPRFAELWAEVPARVRGAQRKTLVHPVVGTFTVDCDALEVQGSDLVLVIFTAEPGSADAAALDEAIRLGSR
ncbi:helix-turn-helix transcriptional regulator [Nocardioides bruguierae]|uniref:helix-turn-helix transcriptional regulator n=1 Tax=Nocardioides bruguierae TaxID=2945102 RepID=UPI00202211F6|nr:helix-turn-helix transcriptional regulator [Nocardioides bruguierae]MCL8024505.1 helix-turn-helix transcriptional regulator [Nocardioides bruguierae]